MRTRKKHLELNWLRREGQPGCCSNISQKFAPFSNWWTWIYLRFRDAFLLFNAFINSIGTQFSATPAIFPHPNDQQIISGRKNGSLLLLEILKVFLLLLTSLNMRQMLKCPDHYVNTLAMQLMCIFFCQHLITVIKFVHGTETSIHHIIL